jgi:hypothetical protein
MIKGSMGRVEREGTEMWVEMERSPEIREIVGDERTRVQGGGRKTPYINCPELSRT